MLRILLQGQRESQILPFIGHAYQPHPLLTTNMQVKVVSRLLSLTSAARGYVLYRALVILPTHYYTWHNGQATITINKIANKFSRNASFNSYNLRVLVCGPSSSNLQPVYYIIIPNIDSPVN